MFLNIFQALKTARADFRKTNSNDSPSGPLYGNGLFWKTFKVEMYISFWLSFFLVVYIERAEKSNGQSTCGVEDFPSKKNTGLSEGGENGTGELLTEKPTQLRLCANEVTVLRKNSQTSQSSLQSFRKRRGISEKLFSSRHVRSKTVEYVT